MLFYVNLIKATGYSSDLFNESGDILINSKNIIGYKVNSTGSVITYSLYPDSDRDNLVYLNVSDVVDNITFKIDIGALTNIIELTDLNGDSVSFNLDDISLCVEYSSYTHIILGRKPNIPSARVSESLEDVMLLVGDSPSGPVQLVVAYTGVQFVFRFKAPITSTLIFHEGDGTVTEVAGNNSTLVTHTTSYSVSDTYSFWITGDVTDLTQIGINDQTMISSGSIARWGELTNLASLAAHRCGLTGSIDVFSGTTLFTYISVAFNNFTGSIESLKDNTGLTVLILDGNNITGDLSELSALSITHLRAAKTSVGFSATPDWTTLGVVKLSDCSFTATEVDNIILSFKNCTNAEINIGGNNANRTSGSDANLITSIGNSNTITLNEASAIGALGAELHTSANAASDPNSNEADATTGWAAVGTANLSSVSAPVSVGSNSIHGESNTSPAHNNGISQTFTVESAEVYRILYDLRHLGVGYEWIVDVSGVLTYVYAEIDDSIFVSDVTYYTATSTSLIFKIKESNASNNGGVYVDNLSVKKVTLP